MEIGTSAWRRNTFGAAFHYRRDEHTEYNDNRPTARRFERSSPSRETIEDTWSIAVENTFAATDKLDIVAGVSHDENDLELAQEFNATAGLFEYPTGGSDATTCKAPRTGNTRRIVSCAA